MYKVITFATLKGGTGKSTTVFFTAGILAERGYKVLIIDVDPQANCTSDLSIDDTAHDYVGVRDILEDPNLLPEEVIIKSPLKELPNIDVMGSSIGVSSTEMRIIGYSAREFILKNYIRKYDKFFSQYDYIVIDTNPSMSIVNQNSFMASDAIVLVTDIGVNSLKGIELFIALWEDILFRFGLDNNIKGILVNKFNYNSSISKEFIEYCQEEEDVGKLLFKNHIPLDEKVLEAELERKPINIYDRESRVFEEYNSFVDELITRL